MKINLKSMLTGVIVDVAVVLVLLQRELKTCVQNLQTLTFQLMAIDCIKPISAKTI